LFLSKIHMLTCVHGGANKSLSIAAFGL